MADDNSTTEIERAAFLAGYAAGDEAVRFASTEIDSYDTWRAKGCPVFAYECWMYPVVSSNLAALGWYPNVDGGRLIVRFVSGTVGEYRCVPRELYDRLLAADSKGVFFSAEIRKQANKYPYRALEPK